MFEARGSLPRSALFLFPPAMDGNINTRMNNLAQLPIGRAWDGGMEGWRMEDGGWRIGWWPVRGIFVDPDEAVDNSHPNQKDLKQAIAFSTLFWGSSGIIILLHQPKVLRGGRHRPHAK
jgi:hypothetical protein